MDFEKQILVLIRLKMLFDGLYKTQDYFRYFLHLFSVPSFIFSKDGLPSKDSLNHSLSLFKDGFTYGHSIQYKMLLVRLHVYRCIKLKSNKQYENSDADLS